MQMHFRFYFEPMNAKRVYWIQVQGDNIFFRKANSITVALNV